MPEMGCEELWKLLTDGERPLIEELRRHISQCQHCGEEEELLLQGLQDYHSYVYEEMPEEFWQQNREAILNVLRKPSLRPWRWLIPVPVTVVLLLILVMLNWNQPVRLTEEDIVAMFTYGGVYDIDTEVQSAQEETIDDLYLYYNGLNYF